MSSAAEERSISGRRQSLLEAGARWARPLTNALPMRRALRRGFDFLLKLQCRGQGMLCTLPGGEAVRVLPEFRHLSWNAREYAAFKAGLPSGGVALDIGANLGCYSLLFAKWAGPTGRVFAFEPAQETFQGLLRHIELNGMQEVVQAMPWAVSDSSKVVLFQADGLNGNNRVVEPGEAASAESVSTAAVSIDGFCAEQGIQPDLIKIDVEGHELDVLRGARETIQTLRGKVALFVEMHPSIWPQIGVSADDIAAELSYQGLRAEGLADKDDPWQEGIACRLLPEEAVGAADGERERSLLAL